MESAFLFTSILAAAVIVLYFASHKLLCRLLGLVPPSHLTSTKPEALRSQPARLPNGSTEGKTSTRGSEHRHVFPPSRKNFVVAQKNVKAFEGSSNATNVERQDLVVPLHSPIDEPSSEEVTSTGFSIKEIQGFGDFPDYTTLSGVPLPCAYPEFNIETALPRPYRPFRWQYFQTMSLAKLEPDWWIELENTYAFRIRQRHEIYQQDPKAALQYLPGSDLACKELMEIALEFLCNRYPQYFSLDKARHVFKNSILGATTELKNVHPLLVLLNNVPEDYAVMMRDPEDGLYYLRAAVICSAQGWSVDTKIGLPLAKIHDPVPHYKEKMQLSMNRFFSKLPTDKPIQRGAWSLEIDQPLYIAPGDPLEESYKHQQQDLALERCHLRVDWQTLRRLPLTGAVVFNFKAFYTPVTSFREEPFIPALLLKTLEEGEETLMKYKHTWHVEHVIKPALAAWAKEQVEQGVVPGGWEAKTLDEAPFFPGWHEKWTKAQGF